MLPPIAITRSSPAQCKNHPHIPQYTRACIVRGTYLVRPMRLTCFIAFVVLVAACKVTAAAEELGTIVDFVPRSRIADSSFGHGFVTLVLQWTDEEHIKPTFIAHSADEFVRQYRQVPAAIQEHGIWLTLAEGDVYSPQEKDAARNLEDLCRMHGLSLFVRTGASSKGWRQASGEREK